jgi:iron complex transport system ATP-binding protein
MSTAAPLQPLEPLEPLEPLHPLQANAVHVALGGRPVLRGTSCSVQPGWTAVVGPNGAGKSTLLRVLAGLLQPSQGQVLWAGQPLATVPARQRGLRLAWLGQGASTTGELTVRETVALGRLPHAHASAYSSTSAPVYPYAPGLEQLRVGSAEPSKESAAIDRALAATDCTALQHRRLAALSGGERQRVLLARALATEAPTLLLDEPTTHLDPPHQVALVRLLRRWAAPPGGIKAVVTVMHDLHLALQADHVLVLQQGQVAAHGAYDSPAVHAALVAVFEGAVRIVPAAPNSANARPTVVPFLDL